MKIAKRIISVLLAIIIIISGIPMCAFSLTAKEQEDFYRVNTWWQDKYNQQYIDWLLESDNFMYHLDISTGNIIHDLSYGSLNLDPKQRKDNFVEILTSFIGLSYDELREQSAVEVFSDISVNFLDGFKDFLEDTQLYTADQFKYMAKAINETSEYYVQIRGIDTTDMEEYGYQTIYKRLQNAFDDNVQDFDWSDRKSETQLEFYKFVKSSEWHNKLSDISDIFSALGDSVELAKDGIALVGELESYNKTDERLVELLKYIRARTTDNALRAACDEVIVKFENSYTQNIVRGVLEIAVDTTLEWAYDEVKDLIVEKCGIYGIWAKIGIVAGNTVSDLWFNTTETKQQMQTIYCLNHISELLVPLLRKELQDLYSYDEASSYSASYAADAIYHMSVLIELRKKGEENYYKLKDSVYGSNIIEACKTFNWGSFADDEQIIEAWYSEFKSVINAVEGSLYKMIPAYHYYKKPQPAEFEKEGSRLIAYNGDSVNVYIPKDVYCNTIDSYAFNRNETIESVNIPYTIETIKANAFYNCTNLKRVTINSTETVIEDGAFVNCHEDFTIYGYYNSTAQEYAFDNDINFVTLDNAYQNSQDYVDSDFIIEDGVLVEYVGDGGDVYIPYGVKEIASYAFNCSYKDIYSIIIPNTVKKINSYAFENLGYTHTLDSLVIGSGVVEIDMPITESVNFSKVIVDVNNPNYYAKENVLFSRNNELVYYPGGKEFVSVYNIPDGVVSINKYAFYQNYGQISIEELYVPESVIEFNDAFSWMEIDSLRCIRVSERNPQYSSYQGILYDKDRENLLYVPKNIFGDIVIPDSVKNIRSKAVFDWCHSLKSLTIGDGVVSMPSLFDCKNLEHIVIGKSVKSYPYNVFDQCVNLKTVTLNAENTKDAVCPAYIEKLIVGENVNYFYADNYNIDSLSEIEFKNSDTVIYGVDVFDDTEFYLTESNWEDDALYINSCLIGLRETVRDFVVKMGTKVICGGVANKLYSIGIPKTVKYICEQNFYYNTIHIFYESDEASWENITILNGNLQTYANHYNVLYGLSEEKIIMPTCLEDGYKTKSCIVCNKEFCYEYENALGHKASNEWVVEQELTCTTDGIKVKKCLNCDLILETKYTNYTGHSYEEIVVLPSCTDKGYTLYMCSVCGNQYKDNYIDALGHNFIVQTKPATCTEDGVIITSCETCQYNCSETISASHTWSDEWTVDIAPTQTTQGSMSRHCLYCEEKTDITIMEKLETEAPAEDFKYWKKDGEVEIYEYIGTDTIINVPSYIEGLPVTKIGGFTFYDNTNVLKINIPDTVTEIEYYAFCDCSELLEVSLGNGITVLSDSLFSGCTKLQKVDMPKSLKKIGVKAFAYCESLSEVLIPDSVEFIEEDAFYRCLWYQNLTEDTIVGNGILMRFNTEFNGNAVIPEGVRLIYSNSIYTVLTETYLQKVVLPSTIIEFNHYYLGIKAESYEVDESNQYLTSKNGVLYSKDLTKIISAPSKMNGSLYVEETVTVIGEYAFYFSSLDEIVLPDGVLIIENGAFQSTECGIVVPESVVEIREDAFSYNDVISEIVVSDGVTEIKNGTFSSCSALEKITLPENIESIEMYAFYECESLKTVIYCGTFEQWQEVQIDDYGNEALEKVTVICLGDEKLIKGDIDGDSKVNASDLALLKKVIAGLVSLDDDSVVNPDVDGEGDTPNAADLAVLKKMIAGLITA